MFTCNIWRKAVDATTREVTLSELFLSLRLTTYYALIIYCSLVDYLVC